MRYEPTPLDASQAAPTRGDIRKVAALAKEAWAIKSPAQDWLLPAQALLRPSKDVNAVSTLRQHDRAANCCKLQMYAPFHKRL